MQQKFVAPYRHLTPFTASWLTLATAISIGALVSPLSAVAQVTAPVQESPAKRVVKEFGAPTPVTGAAPASQAARQRAVTSDFIIALVNREPITQGELVLRSKLLLQQLREANSKTAPNSADNPELMAQAMESLIMEKIQRQLALQSGLSVDDAAVDAGVNQLAQASGLTLAQLQDRLKTDGLTMLQFRDNIRTRILLEKLQNQEVNAKVRVSDNEINLFLRDAGLTQAGAELPTTEEAQVRHILLRTTDAASRTDAIAKLNALRLQINAKTIDFAQAAASTSQDASATSGGALGWTKAGHFVPEFEAAVDLLPMMTVSQPVVTRFGVHLIEVTGRRQSPMTTVQIRDAAAERIRAEKLEKAQQVWLKEIRDNAFVERRTLTE